MKTISHKEKMMLRLLKWTALSCVIGILSGIVGSLFRLAIEWVTELRTENPWFLWLLPLAGVAIVLCYKLCHMEGKGVNEVLVATREGGKLPLAMGPAIFLATALTHMFGGSAGREGAALQLGGGIGSSVGRFLHLEETGMRLVTMCGMAGVFAALFGTPATAAFFVVEAATVGAMCYSGLLPAMMSALTAFFVSGLFGFRLSGYEIGLVPDFTVQTAALSAILAAACALASIAFCIGLHKGQSYAEKVLKNPMLRAALGGFVIIGLTFLVGTRDYNGAGEQVIARAISGEAKPEAFALKLLFTVITISAGFKGGEIVPCFFIGSTLGCVLAGLLGLPPSFGAALGLVCFFCGAVNCPIASTVLAAELFGGQGIALFALGCAVSYVVSGNYSLYSMQILVSSKFELKNTLQKAK